MDFTTSTRVKALGQGFSGSTQDTLIGTLITALSAATERYLDRGIEYTSRTEYFNVEPGQRVLRLHAFPAIASVTLYNDTAHESGTYTQFPATTAVDAGSYAIDTDRGLLIVDDGILLDGSKAVKVTYTGGIASGATSASGLVTAFPDIAQAVDMWVIYALRQGMNPGYTSVAVDGGSVAVGAYAMPLITKDLLERYRRPRVGL